MGNTHFSGPLFVGGYQVYPTITSTVTKTVGAGKDFETLLAAMTWATAQITSHAGLIVLSLDDGIHEVGEPSDFNTTYWAYHVVANTLTIESASGVTANCSITLPSTDDGDQYPTLFTSVHKGSLLLKEVTIDPSLNGYPYSTSVGPVSINDGRLILSKSVIKNADYAVYAWGYGKVEYQNTLIESCDVALSAGLHSTIAVIWGGSPSAEIKNCTTGVSVTESSVANVSNLTFTTNTADTSIPLNEIQYDGSYITNEQAALTLKA